MKREYDFSKAVQGKFSHKVAELNLPIYVGSSMRRRLDRLATKTGKPVAELVKQLLKKDLELLERLS